MWSPGGRSGTSASKNDLLFCICWPAAHFDCFLKIWGAFWRHLGDVGRVRVRMQLDGETLQNWPTDLLDPDSINQVFHRQVYNPPPSAFPNVTLVYDRALCVCTCSQDEVRHVRVAAHYIPHHPHKEVCDGSDTKQSRRDANILNRFCVCGGGGSWSSIKI